jgi:hypothetical protein
LVSEKNQIKILIFLKKQKKRKKNRKEEKKKKRMRLGRRNTHPGGCGTCSAMASETTQSTV